MKGANFLANFPVLRDELLVLFLALLVDWLELVNSKMSTVQRSGLTIF